jgi:hypothetical protein
MGFGMRSMMIIKNTLLSGMRFFKQGWRSGLKTVSRLGCRKVILFIVGKGRSVVHRVDLTWEKNANINHV